MARIQQLSVQLSNQIAAGEVIERPSSVIKELLENSIDSGANKITIEIINGGMKLIKVTDNGCGIEKEDLKLALTRHATSKIKSIEDLSNIKFLGFRGEALPSIASVANLTIISCEQNADNAWQINGKYSKDSVKIQPAAHPVGTTVSVLDLFYNVPARKKFLKTEKTEFNHLLEAVRRIALANHEVAISLKHNGKLIKKYQIATNETQNKQRLADILNPDLVENLLTVDRKTEQYSLTGWVARPTYSRPQADLQYFFVNGRIIRDKLISHASKQAYRDVLYHGRQPAFVLFFNLPLDMVDVNVHPSKFEVRFQQAQSVHSFIRSTIEQVLANEKPQDNFAIEQQFQQQPTTNLKPQYDSSFTQRPLALTSPHTLPETNRTATSEQRSSIAYNEPATNKVSVTEQMASYKKLIPEDEPLPTINHPLGYAIAQLHSTYILAENKQGLVMVDMHAAHERITYERLKTSWQQQKLIMQPLLIPLSISVLENEAEFVEQQPELLHKIGLKLSRIAPTTIQVLQVPALLKKSNLEKLVQESLAEIIKIGHSDNVQNNINSVLASFACHSSIRSGRKLTIDEMNALLRDIEQTERSGQCNHGRPTWVQLNQKEIDGFFMRGK